MNIYKPNFLIFKDKNEADTFVSKTIIYTINKSKSKINLGLATGSTPIDVYKNLVKAYKSEKVDFIKVSTFNLDEYVGLTSNYYKKSYRYFMDNTLFDKININMNNTFFPINWNAEIKSSRTKFNEYDELIAKKGGIDLQILGIGENGHIAFNEPGTKLNSKTSKVNLTPETIEANSRFFKDANEVPRTSVTMGLNTILQAKKIILIAYGDKKLNALKALLSADSFNEEWPCTALLLHPNVTIVTDLINSICLN